MSTPKRSSPMLFDLQRRYARRVPSPSCSGRVQEREEGIKVSSQQTARLVVTGARATLRLILIEPRTSGTASVNSSPGNFRSGFSNSLPTLMKIRDLTKRFPISARSVMDFLISIVVAPFSPALVEHSRALSYSLAP